MNTNFKARAFSILFGQSISLLTSAVMQMAIVWHITYSTGSAVMLTIATLAGYMPQAILGAFAGPIIDRTSKKKLIIFSDTGIALASIILAFLAFTDNMPIWSIWVILIIRSLCNAFHEPTTQALTPLIVPQNYIMRYAGYSQVFVFLSYIISPGIAIVLYDAFPLWMIMAMDTVGAAIAIIILLLIKFPKETFENFTSKPSIFKETKEGFVFLRKQEGVITLIVTGVLFCIIYAPIGSLYPHLSIVYFETTTAQAGFVEIVLAIGSLIGSLLLGRLAHLIPKIKGISISMTLYGLAVFVIGLLAPERYFAFMVLSFFVGFAIPFYHGINRAILQLAIPQEYLGRAFALADSSRRIVMPLGLIAGSVFADGTGINYMFIIGGIAAIVISMVMVRIASLKRFG